MCNFIGNDIIKEEMHLQVDQYFKSKDLKNKGYFTLNEFKKICSDDLGIDLDDPQSKGMFHFFDYVCADDKKDNEDYIDLNYLIKAIRANMK